MNNDRISIHFLQLRMIRYFNCETIFIILDGIWQYAIAYRKRTGRPRRRYAIDRWEIVSCKKIERQGRIRIDMDLPKSQNRIAHLKSRLCSKPAQNNTARFSVAEII